MGVFFRCFPELGGLFKKSLGGSIENSILHGSCPRWVCRSRMSAFLTERQVLLLLGAILLAACSADPAARKIRYLHSGERYFAKAEFRAAEVEFRNALAIDSRFEAAHFRLAETYLKLAEYGSARREMEATVALNPRNIQAQTQLTGMFLASQQYLQAQQLAEKLLAEDQTNATAREMLGAANYATRNIPTAIQELQKTII